MRSASNALPTPTCTLMASATPSPCSPSSMLCSRLVNSTAALLPAGSAGTVPSSSRAAADRQRAVPRRSSGVDTNLKSVRPDMTCRHLGLTYGTRTPATFAPAPRFAILAAAESCRSHRTGGTTGAGSLPLVWTRSILSAQDGHRPTGREGAPSPAGDAGGHTFHAPAEPHEGGPVTDQDATHTEGILNTPLTRRQILGGAAAFAGAVAARAARLGLRQRRAAPAERPRAPSPSAAAAPRRAAISSPASTPAPPRTPTTRTASPTSRRSSPATSCTTGLCSVHARLQDRQRRSPRRSRRARTP